MTGRSRRQHKRPDRLKQFYIDKRKKEYLSTISAKAACEEHERTQESKGLEIPEEQNNRKHKGIAKTITAERSK